MLTANWLRRTKIHPIRQDIRFLRLEALEHRCVPAALFSETALAAGSSPNWITADTSTDPNHVWVAERGSNRIGRVSSAGVLDGEFTVSPAQPTIAAVTDGPTPHVWFTNAFGASPAIGEMDTSGQIVQSFNLTSDVARIIAGPNWDDPNSGPGDKTSLWFSEYYSGDVGRIDPDGSVHYYSVPFGINDIAIDSQGNLWCTPAFSASNLVVRLNKGGGSYNQFPIPAGGIPRGLAADTNGDVWTCSASGQILKINSAGQVTRYSIPSGNSGYTIVPVTGGTGGFWFAEPGAGNIGHITPSGQIAEIATPTPNSGVDSLVALSDGSVWFTEPAADKIGRIQLLPAAATFVARDSSGAVIPDGGSVDERRTVHFDASASEPSGDSTAVYAWDFGNGNVANGPQVDRIFYPGTITVTLTVTDRFAGTTAVSQTITVIGPPAGPSATFSVSGTYTPLDPTFGVAGRVLTQVPGTVGDEAAVVSSLPDGRVVVLGTVTDPSSNSSQVAVLRYQPGGNLDTSFGTGGSGWVANLGPNSSPVAMAAQPDGTAIVTAIKDGQFVVARYLSNGMPDPLFGVHGIAQVGAGISPLAGDYNVAWNPMAHESIAVQPDGKIVLTGLTTGNWFGPNPDEVSLLRLNADGTTDPTFGTSGNGEVIANFGTGDSTGYGVTIQTVQSTSYILVVGLGGALARYRLDGSLDTTFGQGGVVPPSGAIYSNKLAYDPFAGDSFLTPPVELLMRPNGQFVVIGAATEPNYPALTVGLSLVQYTPSGLLDTSFGTDGITAITSGNDVIESGWDTVLFGFMASMESDGHILLVGRNFFSVPPPARITPGGKVDSVFGVGGSQSFSDFNMFPHDMTATSDGQVLLTGEPLAGTMDHILVDRYTPGPEHAVAGEDLSFDFLGTDPKPAVPGNPFVNYPFTFDIDWGDGTPHFVGQPAEGTTHVFATAGSYTVSVTATDVNGTSLPFTSDFVVDAPATGLQGLIATALPFDPNTGLPTATFEAGTGSAADAILSAVNALPAQSSPVEVLLNLGSGTFTDLNASPPAGVTLVVNGNGTTTTIVGSSPALTVASGNVIVTGVTLTTATNAPTVLVTGGSLTMRNDIIQESTGYSDPAVQITGGMVDLGTSADPGGNTINVNGAGTFTRNTNSSALPTVGDDFTINGGPVMPSTLSGIVWEDFNDDGQVDFGENGIHGATITLTGIDYLFDAVSLSQTTDGDGAYVFDLLLSGNYKVTETQPAGYLQGIDTVGTAGGSVAAADQFLIPLGPGVNGLNYNFGEQPAATGPVKKGQVAGIGFWNNKNGQVLINALNSGVGTGLADWLAATMPNTFGVNAGSNNLTGKSNAYVANLFQQDFVMKGVKLDAQVLATALNVYATNATLDSTRVAAQYGFTVSDDGLGAAGVNVGSDGDAFGVANNTTMTVLDLLKATDLQSVSGVPYGGNATKRSHANDVFGAINQAGGL
jgi:uncharacterized delta-60 repeat protein